MMLHTHLVQKFTINKSRRYFQINILIIIIFLHNIVSGTNKNWRIIFLISVRYEPHTAPPPPIEK